MKISRRGFIKTSACAAGAGLSKNFSKVANNLIKAPYLKNSSIPHKTIVIGIDGMDPVWLRKFIRNGDMPTFEKVINGGAYSNIRTTTPPHTPVAWSSFISGTDPGGHGIFDFVHRDASKFQPYLSTSKTTEAKSKVSVGNWNVPLGSGKVELMRKGTALWSVLEENHIPSTVFQIPANFPVTKSSERTISGMGTPDLLGGYGTSTLFSEETFPGAEKLTGGRVIVVKPENNKIVCTLPGPKNEFKTDKQTSNVDFIVNRDPLNSTITLKVQNHEVLLQEGEWSDWLPLSFEMLPMFVSLSGIVRVFVKQVHPHFKMYVTPINIDPMDPVLPICTPNNYSKELSQAVGRFYTQGFPADTKALSSDFLNDDQFLELGKYILNENLRAFEYEFERFHEGLFFFYFSSIDQMTHMFWRTMDESHPQYNPNASKEVKGALRYFYREMDKVLNRALSKVDSNTLLVVMSDHGFVPFTREFNVSTWLVENGFTSVTDSDEYHDSEFYNYIDWKRTKAYAMGLNGVYINIKGREKNGSVEPKDVPEIKKALIEKIQSQVDPKTGEKVVFGAYDSEQIYSHTNIGLAPDILLGYNRGYRISDESALGKFPKEILNDRDDKWSADHCLEPSLVPGIFISNRPIKRTDIALWDVAPSIIETFGLKVPTSMTGRNFF